MSFSTKKKFGQNLDIPPIRLLSELRRHIRGDVKKKKMVILGGK